LAGSVVVGTTSMSYDAAIRETNLQFKDASGTNISSFTYTYDSGNRLTSETLNGSTVSYQYDATNQLTQAGTTTYGYRADALKSASIMSPTLIATSVQA
jgi:YD repeat-containing protein